MKSIFWIAAMVLAWFLLAVFARQYSMNRYTLERMRAVRDESREHLRTATAERDALESAVVALKSDPFYTERLLRDVLGWVRPDESAGPQSGQAEAPVPLQRRPVPDEEDNAGRIILTTGAESDPGDLAATGDAVDPRP